MTPLTTSAAVPRAEVIVQDLDVDELGRPDGEIDERPGLLLERRAEHGRDLPGDAEMAERVGTVGVGLDVEDDVPVALLAAFNDKSDHGQAVEELAAAGRRHPRSP